MFSSFKDSFNISTFSKSILSLTLLLIFSFKLLVSFQGEKKEKFKKLIEILKNNGKICFESRLY